MAKGNDEMRADYDDNSHEHEVENENEVAETGMEKKKKRGRKSAAEKAEEAKQEENMQIYDVEFDNRNGMESDIDAFRITCGKCIFYDKLATYGKPCIQRGIVASSKPCSRFQFNLTSVQRKKIPNLLSALTEFQKSGASLSELIALTATARQAKKVGFAIGQSLWFSTSPHSEDQTIDTWYGCVVIGGRDGKVLVMTTDGAQLLLSPSMLVTEDEFSKISFKPPRAKREVHEKIYGLTNVRTIDDEEPELEENDDDEKKPRRSSKRKLVKPARNKVHQPVNFKGKATVRLRG